MIDEWEKEFKENQKLYEEYDGKDEEELKWELVYTQKMLKEICKRHNIDLLKEIEALIIENSKKLEKMYDVKSKMRG